MLRGLVARAAVGSALQQTHAKDKAGASGASKSGAQPNGKTGHSNRSPRCPFACHYSIINTLMQCLRGDLYGPPCGTYSC